MIKAPPRLALNAFHLPDEGHVSSSGNVLHEGSSALESFAKKRSELFPTFEGRSCRLSYGKLNARVEGKTTANATRAVGSIVENVTRAQC